jgi:hypothetical protein
MNAKGGYEGCRCSCVLVIVAAPLLGIELASNQRRGNKTSTAGTMAAITFERIDFPVSPKL